MKPVAKGENTLCSDDFVQVHYTKKDYDYSTSDVSSPEIIGVTQDSTSSDPILDPQFLREGSSEDSVKSDLIDYSTEGSSPDVEPDMPTCNQSKVSDQESSFTCQLCNKSFLQRRYLRNHIKTHLNDKPFKCSKCEMAFTKKQSLERHSINHNNDGVDLKCPVCGKTLENVRNLNRHLKTHEENKSYKCKACQKSFLRIFDLKRHELRHTGVKPYTCALCRKSFRLVETLKRHLLTHEKKKSSSTTSRLSGQEDPSEMPVENEHEVFGSEISQLNSEYLSMGNHFMCASLVCSSEDSTKNSSLFSKLSFKCHSFRCDYCSKTFESNKKLTKHAKIHNEDKPHGCVTCGKRFDRMYGLQRHSLTHRTEKPFVCKLCGAGYRQICTLKKHVFIKHITV